MRCALPCGQAPRENGAIAGLPTARFPGPTPCGCRWASAACPRDQPRPRPADRGCQLVGRDGARQLRHRGQLQVVLHRHGEQAEPAAPAVDRRTGAVDHEVDRLGGQRARDVGQQPARDENAADTVGGLDLDASRGWAAGASDRPSQRGVVVVFRRCGALHGIGAAPSPPTEERCRDGNRQEGQAHR